MSGGRFSFEFFPPRSPEVAQRLHRAATVLASHDVAFFSVTYGADGADRDGTVNTVQQLRRNTGVEVVPHISCIRTPPAELRRLLDRYRDSGIRRLVAIRGDRRKEDAPAGPLCCGSDLVAFIREHYGNRFEIRVAAYPECHPEAPGMQADIAALRRKVDAGAKVAITQYFYNIDAYRYFVDACAAAGIDIPVVAGIMPIHELAQVQRFSARCGAEVPRWLVQRMLTFADASSRREFAADVVGDLGRRLLEAGAPGLHFFTLNRAEPARAVLERLQVCSGRRQANGRSVA